MKTIQLQIENYVNQLNEHEKLTGLRPTDFLVNELNEKGSYKETPALKRYNIESKQKSRNVSKYPKVVAKIAEQFDEIGSVVNFFISESCKPNVLQSESLVYEGLLLEHNEYVLTSIAIEDYVGVNLIKTLNFIKKLEKTLHDLSNVEVQHILKQRKAKYENYEDFDYRNAYRECTSLISKNCFGFSATSTTSSGSYIKGVTSAHILADNVRHKLYVRTPIASFEVDIIDASHNLKDFFITAGANTADTFWEMFGEVCECTNPCQNEIEIANEDSLDAILCNSRTI